MKYFIYEFIFKQKFFVLLFFIQVANSTAIGNESTEDSVDSMEMSISEANDKTGNLTLSPGNLEITALYIFPLRNNENFAPKTL